MCAIHIRDESTLGVADVQTKVWREVRIVLGTPGSTIWAYARRHMDRSSFLQRPAWLPRSCAGAEVRTDFLRHVERLTDYTVRVNDKYADLRIDILLNWGSCFLDGWSRCDDRGGDQASNWCKAPELDHLVECIGLYVMSSGMKRDWAYEQFSWSVELNWWFWDRSDCLRFNLSIGEKEGEKDMWGILYLSGWGNPDKMNGPCAEKSRFLLPRAFLWQQI